jgi:hypothetical protein
MYMNQVRQFYIDILSEIAAGNLLEDIMGQLIGSPVKLEYTHPDLYKDIQQSEYMLS